MMTKLSDVKTTFTGVDFSKYSSKVSAFVSEFASRANQKGQFLNWVNLPQEQAKRVDSLYELANNLKNLQTALKNYILAFKQDKQQVVHVVSDTNKLKSVETNYEDNGNYITVTITANSEEGNVDFT